MGNCCSDVAGGQSAVGGTNSSLAAHVPNEAVDAFLKSRGYNGLFSQIEVHRYLFAPLDMHISTNYVFSIHFVKYIFYYYFFLEFAVFCVCVCLGFDAAVTNWIWITAIRNVA